MKRLLLTLSLSLLLAAGGIVPAAEAGWMWTPQTGWVGPGGAVKDTPEEQLAFAVAFFDRKDYDRAKREFKKLLKAYKESREAPEAQYYLARCYEEDGDYYKAFLEYRKTLQVYPSTKRFDEILERMYQIGNLFLAGQKRKVMGTAALLPSRHKAIEVFQAIVEDGPFSEYGELAQYKLGLAQLALGDFEPAVTAFEQLISRYPDSPLVDDAHFQIAQASLKGVFKAGYDQHPTDTAVKELSTFLQTYPESDLSPEARQRVEALAEQRAAHEFQVAQFYEGRRRLDAALICYEHIVNRYAQTAWAPKAASRIQVLESRIR